MLRMVNFASKILQFGTSFTSAVHILILMLLYLYCWYKNEMNMFKNCVFSTCSVETEFLQV